MGNCFGKESKNFDGEGRPLGSAPPPPPPPQPVNTSTSTYAPKKAAYTPTPSGGRVLGASADAAVNDPKSAAARAAEERAKANHGQPKGKLGRQLDAQRAQTNTGHLASASAENRAARDADAAAETRAWN